MRNSCALALLISAISISPNSLSAPFSGVAVGYKDCAEFPGDIKFHDTPSFCSGKNSIAIMISGEGISSIKDDSLKISSLTLGDRDISKNRLGSKSYSMGSFPKVTESGKHAIFELEIDKPIFGELSKVKVDGEIVVLTSDELGETSKDGINLSTGFSEKMGPYKVSSAKEGGESGVGDVLRGGISQAFSGLLGEEDSKQNEAISIKVVGDLDALVGVDLIENGKVVESQGSFWSGNEKTFNYYGVSSKVVNIKLRYWKNMKEVPVKIQVN